MIEFEVYQKLQELKNKGFNRKQVSEEVGIAPSTTRRYWDLTADDYWELKSKSYNNHKPNQCMNYKDDILEHLTAHPELTIPQLTKKLKEKYGPDLPFSERTMRNFVYQLRIDYNLPKPLLRDVKARDQAFPS